MVKVIGFIFSIVSTLFVLLVVSVIVIIPIAYVMELVERHRNRRLQTAPAEFTGAGRELDRHVNDCRAILIAEVRNKNPLRGRSPFGLARAKTMRLLGEARPAIRRLYRSDPTEQRYTQKVRIERLHECCSRCVARNGDGTGPVCGVFDGDGEVFVDLNFGEG